MNRISRIALFSICLFSAGIAAAQQADTPATNLKNLFVANPKSEFNRCLLVSAELYCGENYGPENVVIVPAPFNKTNLNAAAKKCKSIILNELKESGCYSSSSSILPKALKLTPDCSLPDWQQESYVSKYNSATPWQSDVAVNTADEAQVFTAITGKPNQVDLEFTTKFFWTVYTESDAFIDQKVSDIPFADRNPCLNQFSPVCNPLPIGEEPVTDGQGNCLKERNPAFHITAKSKVSKGNFRTAMHTNANAFKGILATDQTIVGYTRTPINAYEADYLNKNKICMEKKSKNEIAWVAGKPRDISQYINKAEFSCADIQLDPIGSKSYGLSQRSKFRDSKGNYKLFQEAKMSKTQAGRPNRLDMARPFLGK